jgi:hypothetical protein
MTAAWLNAPAGPYRPIYRSAWWRRLFRLHP